MEKTVTAINGSNCAFFFIPCSFPLGCCWIIVAFSKRPKTDFLAASSLVRIILDFFASPPNGQSCGTDQQSDNKNQPYYFFQYKGFEIDSLAVPFTFKLPVPLLRNAHAPIPLCLILHRYQEVFFALLLSHLRINSCRDYPLPQ